MTEKERYWQRKEAGLCTKCGKTMDRKGVLCASCAKKKSERSSAKYNLKKDEINRRNKELYWQRKEAGLCGVCGKPRDQKDKSLCDLCLQKARKNKQDNRAWYLSQSYCPVCHTERLYGKETICPECSANRYMINNKYKENHKEKVNEMSRIYYRKRREQGICERCGKPAMYGHAYCPICNEINTRRVRENRALKNNDYPRSERVNYGRCYRCGKPLDTDKKLCSICCEKAAANLPKTGASQDHVWRKQNYAMFEQWKHARSARAN